MAITFDQIVCSKPFQFIVGPDRKLFTVHAALVADNSAPLSRLINGSMREAKDGVVIMDDIDEQTFLRFCEYAYMGEYTPVENEFRLASKDGKTLLPPVEGEESVPSGSKKKKKSKSSSMFGDLVAEPHCEKCGDRTKQILWDEFQIRDYSVISPRLQPRGSLEEGKGDTSLFLCHARVYVFADKYDIIQLRNLALDKLHQTLRSFKAVGNQTESVVDLIRFSYSNDNTRDNEAGQQVDSLRKMVVHFVACMFEDVVMNDSFLALMEEGGPLVRDLAALLAKRITC